ncbi:capsid protein [Enterococcus faecium]|nr:capsid protein [Enterococcus faecium]
MLHIKVEKNGINRKLSVMNIQKATFFMTNQMHMDMNLYAPKRQGHLHSDSYARENHIVYTVPYAKAQFRGLIVTKSGKIARIKNYTTPGTGRRWDLRAKSKHINAWRKAFVEGGKL